MFDHIPLKSTMLIAAMAMAGASTAATLYTTSFENPDLAHPWLFDYPDWSADTSVWAVEDAFGATDGAFAAYCALHTMPRGEMHWAELETALPYAVSGETPGVRVEADVLLTDQPRLYGWSGKGTGWAGIVLGSHSNPIAKLVMRSSTEAGQTSAVECYVRTAAGLQLVSEMAGASLNAWTHLGIEADYTTGLLSFSVGETSSGEYAFVGDPTAQIGLFSTRYYPDRFNPNPIWSAFDKASVATTNAVPEPATWVLAAGLLMLARRPKRPS